MARRSEATTDLTIAIGAQNSNAIAIRDAASVWLFAPAVFDGTISVQVSPTTGVADDFVTLQDGTTDVTLTASRAKAILGGGAGRLRLRGSVVQTALVTVPCMMQVEN